MDPRADFIAQIQKACLPGVWSKGVALQRAGAVSSEPGGRDGELRFRVLVQEKPVSPKVNLWPEDEDYFCDCGDRADPCAHVAAAVIALKTLGTQPTQATTSAPSTGPAGATPAPSSRPPQRGPRLEYRLKREDGALRFERWIVTTSSSGTQESLLNDSLVAYVGGIQSGRIQAPSLPATQDDFAVDRALGPSRGGILDPATLRRVIAALAECSSVTLDGTPIQASSRTIPTRVEVVSEGSAFRLRRLRDGSLEEAFKNGAALSAGTLRAIEIPSLSPQEADWLRGEGKLFSAAEVPALVSEILPALSKKLTIASIPKNLPALVQEPPRILLKMQKREDGSLSVMPVLAYGNPPIAEVQNGRLELLSRDRIPERDLVGEKQWVRRIQTELHLSPGQLATFQGIAAVDFAARLKNWETIGEEKTSFSATEKLQPRLAALDGGSFQLSFGIGGNASGDPRSERGEADLKAVFGAWRRGEAFVPMQGGGWAQLPADWFSRYGEKIAAMLEASSERDHKTRTLPAYVLPEFAAICEELGTPLPASLRRLRDALQKHEGIPEAKLPADLQADLRSYQKQGINWLSFLRDSGMGAMLADDMGLGKTLQAICSIQGRTLVVAPTSVLYGWLGQFEKFRPKTSVSVFYGPGRKLTDAQVVLTTYSILRIDRERLAAQDWDTIVLDEAQTIKNPESQAARAAFELRGKFRIALTGTPVENRLEDLWSQFQFVNPGLLGSRETFQDQFSEGGRDWASRLRTKIRPFLLRRLKKDVAPELPPRTETLLHCELTQAERDLYESIQVSARKEVLEQLGQGKGSFMQALEALLRLRQACCHPALIPGQNAATSSKLELLLETLEESISLGHRALIFSQWTSLLDRIEPLLRQRHIEFLRLDGSTRDRNQVVEQFQDPKGPPAMLISLKAGGVGLTLTAADHIFILDPWWNPAVEDQAADRAHRIGQTNPVLIHRLVAKDTVEDRILALQRKKQELAGAVLEGSAQAISITSEEILSLLEG